MKTQVITEKVIKEFAAYLKNEEKSKNTIEKYLRDVRKFSEYMNGLNTMTKQTTGKSALAVMFQKKILTPMEIG